MAGETTITIVGNLTDDPELRFTPSGAAVANFTVASTPRSFNKQSNDWEDGEAMFLRCSIWRQAAENVAESLQRGMRVVVQGRLKARSYETREGEKRTVFEVEVEEIGPSLKFATAKVNRVSRSGGGGYSGGGGQSSGGQGGQGSDGQGSGGQGSGGQGSGGQGGGGRQDDPWATPAPAGGQGSGGSGGSGGGQGAANDPWGAPGVGSEEPPF